MKFLRFYATGSIVLLTLASVQQLIRLAYVCPLTHSVGVWLLALLLLWWIPSMIAVVKLKKNDLPLLAPLSWLSYQILTACSAGWLLPILAANPSLNSVHALVLFCFNVLFIAAFCLLLKDLDAARHRPVNPNQHQSSAIAIGATLVGGFLVAVCCSLYKAGLFHEVLGLVHYSQGRYQKAIEAVSAAINLQPTNGGYFMLRGVAYEQIGQHQKAIDDYTAAIHFNPKDLAASAHAYRGAAFDKLGQDQNAIVDCNKAVLLDPQGGEAYSIRAVVYENLGKPDLAEQDRKRAAELGYVEQSEAPSPKTQ